MLLSNGRKNDVHRLENASSLAFRPVFLPLTIHIKFNGLANVQTSGLTCIYATDALKDSVNERTYVQKIKDSFNRGIVVDLSII